MLELKKALIDLLGYCQTEHAERVKMLTGLSGMPDYTRYGTQGKAEAYADVAARLKTILDSEAK